MRSLMSLVLLLVSLTAFGAPPQDSLAWSAPTVCADGSPITSCPVTGYVISVANDPKGVFVPAGTVDAATVTFVVPNTSAGTRCYQVAATSAGGNSAPSNTACKTQAVSVPAGVGIVLTVK